MKAMIEAGAAAVHFEDQLSSAKKCGHLGGKVVVPIREFEQKLIAARLAADVLGVPTILIARTDADSAKLLLSDIDSRDERFLTGGRTEEGFYCYRGGLEAAITRGLAYAPYADLIWCETSEPDIGQAREFAAAIHAYYPGKLLAYNCSPSFHWKKMLNDHQIAIFQMQLAELGYKYQFVTLAGFHALNLSMFELARDYARGGMNAYVRLQEREFALQDLDGYGAVRHQRFVGTGYFDAVQTTISQGRAATEAMEGSTETAQFNPDVIHGQNGSSAALRPAVGAD
jgi:isocitrate lyase